MKRILLLTLALCLLLACPALAQRIDMDDAHVSFDYPDTWLVVSPQLCTTYAQLLADAGVATDIHYATPPHRQPCYSQWSTLSLPVTDRIANTVVSLPISSAVSLSDAAEIAAIINSINLSSDD